MKKTSKPKSPAKKTFNSKKYETMKRKVYGMDKTEERKEERGKA